MKIIIADGGQRNERCIRYEIRTYDSWSDAKRAETLLKRSGARCVPFLDTHGPALQISLYRQSSEESNE